MSHKPFTAATISLLLAACGPKVATVEISPAAATLGATGQTQQLTAAAKDAQGKAITEGLTWVWSSTAAAVAEVDANGMVKAVKSGSATITAATGEKSGAAQIEVRIPAKLMVEPAAITLSGMGTAAPIAAKVHDDAGRPIPGAQAAFSSSPEGVVSVANGQIVATAPGTTMVTATMGPLSATAQVTVTLPPFAKLALTPDKNELAAGSTAQLSASATDEAGNPVPGMAFTFKSSDEKVATVDAKGMVTAVAKGKAAITAAAGDKSATAAVKVK